MPCSSAARLDERAAIEGLDPICQSCGSCCVAPLDPETQFRYIVELDRGEEKQFTSREFKRFFELRKRIYINKIRKRHPDGKACMAFRGRVGGSCSCLIYERRPRMCRKFEPKSAICLIWIARAQKMGRVL